MTESVFCRKGNIYTTAAKQSLDFEVKLPVGNYVLKFHPEMGFYLEQTDSYEFTFKLYGDTIKNTNRILQTFKTRSHSTGVMMVGEKGSGKTLLARRVSYDAAKQGIPTIIINSAFFGDGFNSFIAAIKQEVVILFDEFEKVYDDDEKQNGVLTLLDGVFPMKKLFIITSNNKYKIGAFFHNRPGRIYYMFEFTGISEDFVREYCADVLDHDMQKYIERVVFFSGMFQAFNFDMLKAMCEEMNRYKESPDEVSAFLNTRPEYGASNKEHDVEIHVNGQKIAEDDIGDSFCNVNPLLMRHLRFSYRTDKKDEDGDDEWLFFDTYQKDLVSFGKKKYIFEPKVDRHGKALADKIVLILKEKEQQPLNWRDYDGPGGRHGDYF